jgi:hypothetical protein
VPSLNLLCTPCVSSRLKLIKLSTTFGLFYLVYKFLLRLCHPTDTFCITYDTDLTLVHQFSSASSTRLLQTAKLWAHKDPSFVLFGFHTCSWEVYHLDLQRLNILETYISPPMFNTNRNTKRCVWVVSRAKAQPRLSPRRTVFNTRIIHMSFVINRMILRKLYIRFPYQFSSHQCSILTWPDSRPSGGRSTRNTFSPYAFH